GAGGEDVAGRHPADEALVPAVLDDRRVVALQPAREQLRIRLGARVDGGGDGVRLALEVLDRILARASALPQAARDAEDQDRDQRDQARGEDELAPHPSNRKPTRRTVEISGGSPSLRRSHDMCMSSVLVDPYQWVSQTSSMIFSRSTTRP